MKIPCKSPLEIKRMLESFETRRANLLKGYNDGIPTNNAIKIIKLEAKIHILKNILKLK